MINDPSQALARLLDICRRLMADDGCPWDREQTLESITPYLQEELHEILDAIAAQDASSMAEEMGDLFYLLVFAAALGQKQGFPLHLGSILDGASDKLIRRHPHVFGEVAVSDTADAVARWEEIKKSESSSTTTLGRRPAGLAALTTAYRIQEKAAAVRFEWVNIRGALAKLKEEIEELEATLDDTSEGADHRRQDEIGDVLYSVVNLARYVRVDPELALRGTITKFMNRFHFIEEELARIGKTPSTSNLAEMDALWNEAKKRGIR